MWRKIMIPVYRLWLHCLYGLYGPHCLLSPERLLDLITHWLLASLGHQQPWYWLHTPVEERLKMQLYCFASKNIFCRKRVHWGPVCHKQVSRAEKSNYILQFLWDVLTCPCPWWLLLAHTSPIQRSCHLSKINWISRCLKNMLLLSPECWPCMDK